jgi:hypothetical protein
VFHLNASTQTQQDGLFTADEPSIMQVIGVAFSHLAFAVRGIASNMRLPGASREPFVNT